MTKAAKSAESQMLGGLIVATLIGQATGLGLLAAGIGASIAGCSALRLAYGWADQRLRVVLLRATSLASPPFALEMLSDLPEPVQRFYRFALQPRSSLFGFWADGGRSGFFGCRPCFCLPHRLAGTASFGKRWIITAPKLRYAINVCVKVWFCR